ncbi:MAG TPA: hypothetical protein VIR33_02080, partial [Thermopolyspora sp.]
MPDGTIGGGGDITRAVTGNGAGTGAGEMLGDVIATLTGFARTLRAAGVAADRERTQNLVAALAHLDAAEPDDVYWTGRFTLCSGPDDFPRYDRCFAAYFSGARAGVSRSVPNVTVTRHLAALDAPGSAREVDGETVPTTASRAELLRHRDVAGLTAAEREEVNRMLALLDGSR